MPLGHEAFIASRSSGVRRTSDRILDKQNTQYGAALASKTCDTGIMCLSPPNGTRERHKGRQDEAILTLGDHFHASKDRFPVTQEFGTPG
jgi:hypothetical protein